MINLNQLWKTIKKNKKMKRNVKEVSIQDINLKEYMIIDVRSKREFKETHLNGAINIPLPEIRHNIEKYVKNKNEKILMCCQSGTRSKNAVGILENMGYTQVYNLIFY